MTRHPLTLVFAVLLFGPTVAVAQQVRGRVIDAATHLPLASVAVQLHGAGGRIVTQQLTAASGGFLLQAPAGEYQLTLAAIGYARHISVDVTLGDQELRLPDILLTAVAIRLPELQAMAGKRACGKSELTPETFGGVLESAHASLEVMDATLQQGQIGFVMQQVSSFSHHVSGDSNVNTADTLSAGMHRWPVVSPALDTLKLFGFGAAIHGTTGDGYVFWGPDLVVLFSEWFLDNHCYSVDVSRSRGDTVVIRFEPAKGSKKVDVSGELVLDRATLTLRRLSYQHTNLPNGVPGKSVGGEMHFGEPLPGYLLPMDWGLWMPVTETTRIIYRPRTVIMTGGRGSGVPPPMPSMAPTSTTRIVGKHEVRGKLTRIVPVTGG